VLIASGNMACKKASEETLEETSLTKDTIPFEGVVKIALGKYLHIPKAQGFDIVIQGELQSGDLSTLVDKEVKGEGMFSPERPSVLIADSLEVKDESGVWQSLFTRTEEAEIEDYFDERTRKEFPVLENLSYDKKEGWEGKGKVKVYGKLEVDEDVHKIVLSNDRGRLVGKVVIDDFTDFGRYYMKKLRLFDSFWFYINVKETIDWSERRRSREMFHADVMFAGLF